MTGLSSVYRKLKSTSRVPDGFNRSFSITSLFLDRGTSLSL